MTDAVYRDGKYILAPAPLPPPSRHPFLHFKFNSHQLSIHVPYILPSVLLLGTWFIYGTWTGTHCRVRSENICLNSLQPRLTQVNELLLAGGLTFVQPAVHANCHTGKKHRTLAMTKTQPAQTTTSQRGLKNVNTLLFFCWQPTRKRGKAGQRGWRLNGWMNPSSWQPHMFMPLFWPMLLTHQWKTLNSRLFNYANVYIYKWPRLVISCRN